MRHRVARLVRHSLRGGVPLRSASTSYAPSLKPLRGAARHISTSAMIMARSRPMASTLLGATLGAAFATAAACLCEPEDIMSPGSVMDDYEIGAELGNGHFASVHRGRCRKTGREVAIKIVPKSRQTAASIRHEAAVLKRVSMHRRIASLEALYETPQCFYIVMEYVSGGELFDHLCDHGAMTEREAATLVSELAGAIAILHAQGMCHADIKPENLLLTADGHVKLVDFGLSCQFDRSTGGRVDPNANGASVGTMAYWAPEVFVDPKGPGLANDMWALGVITHMLLTAAHPFDDNGKADDDTIRRNICYGEPNFEDWTASEQAKQFVLMLLRKDPKQRLSIEQLLQHPWIWDQDAASTHGSGTGGTGGMGDDGAAGSGNSRIGFFRRGSKDRAAEKARAEEARMRDEKMRQFRAHTGKLRAACFSVLLQQYAEDQKKEQSRIEAEAAESGRSGAKMVPRRTRSLQAGRAALRRYESMRGPMLEGEMLKRTFRVFDVDGKGYISGDDVTRVLHKFGQSGAGADEWLQGMTYGDREGQRITYGSFVRMMTHTVKRAFKTGDYVFQQGEPVRYFHALLNGEVEVVRKREDGSEEVLNTLRAGEYFGENSLLEGSAKRNVSIRAATPIEVLQLSKEDFEAAFGPERSAAPSAAVGGGEGVSAAKLVRRSSGEEERRRSKLISFIRMVSCQQHRTLREGEHVFKNGDDANKFYILASGQLRVTAEAASPSAHSESGAIVLGSIDAGEGFGESSLLGKKSKRTKTITCATNRCEVVEVLGEDFLRLIEKSHFVRESFQWLNKRRTLQNERVQAQHEDPVMKKYLTK